MKRSPLKPLLLLSVLLVCTGTVCAQGNFLYTNDNNNPNAPPFLPNTVHGYSVADDGTLSDVPGSPFLTRGIGSGGGFFASSRLTICSVGKFLYVANDATHNISAFFIDADTGTLTLVPGSPFATGGNAGNGMSLAATPDNQFLFAANAGSQDVSVFQINSDGSLTLAGDPAFAGGAPIGVKVTPDGNFLLLALPNEGPHGSVVVFGIDSGELTSPRFPFPTRRYGNPPGSAAGIDVDCKSDTVAVGEAVGDTTVVDVLSLDPATGALAQVPGSPFHPNVGFNSNVPLFSVDDSVLFVSNQASNSVTSFTVDPDDRHLTLVGSFGAGVGGAPSGMATNQGGTLLYLAKAPNFIAVFTIDSGGILTPAGVTSLQASAGVEAVAAFPPKTCQ